MKNQHPITNQTPIDDESANKVTTYKLNELIEYNSEQIHQVQKLIENDAQAHLKEILPQMPFLSSKEEQELFEYFDNTMEKFRLLINAIVYGFTTHSQPGYPENIYNINLDTGKVERDKNNRRIDYNIEILAPCSTSLLRYINKDGNNVFVALPPIKSYKRTTQKIITECVREYNDSIKKDLKTFKPVKEIKTYKNFANKLLDLQKIYEQNNNFFSKYTRLPKDIYRLTVTSKYKSDLEELIKQFSNNFPDYIKFEENKRNAYEKSLAENSRFYFDIKNTAKITIPNTDKSFYIEFQFKQTNMFFAHIRSHSAYASFRKLDDIRLRLKDSIGNNPSPEDSIKLEKQEQLCKKKLDLCLEIHKNAVKQSNLYLMHKISWLDNNARGLNRCPDNPDGTYNHSIDVIRKNYIITEVKDDELFDGVTAFSTSDKEYLNKAYYLKMIDVLPEHFDELKTEQTNEQKSAKEIVDEYWRLLTPADIKDFKSISNSAIKYQDTIRQMQKEQQKKEDEDILNAFILKKTAKMFD